MIWSVSTSARPGGSAGPVTRRPDSINALSAQVRGEREVAGDRRGRGHGRGHQMRAPARALPALEVAVRGRRATLAGTEDVGVHAEAHGAPRAAPIEARFLAHTV